MKIVAFVACTLVVSAPAWAQSPASSEKVPEAPSMTSSATPSAPVAPGSTRLHEVPPPSVAKRSTNVGTGQKLTGQGGN